MLQFVSRIYRGSYRGKGREHRLPARAPCQHSQGGQGSPLGWDSARSRDDLFLRGRTGVDSGWYRTEWGTVPQASANGADFCLSFCKFGNVTKTTYQRLVQVFHIGRRYAIHSEGLGSGLGGSASCFLPTRINIVSAGGSCGEIVHVTRESFAIEGPRNACWLLVIACW